MRKQPYETLILKLADRLVGGRTDAKTVTECLELLCGGLSLDCGFVYEADSSGHFIMTERSPRDGARVPQSFSAEEAGFGKQRGPLTWDTVSFLSRGGQNTPCEDALLDLFIASSLAVLPVTDGNQHAYGLIVLRGGTGAEPLTNEEKKAASVLLSMLARYVAIRMYQNKLTQAKTSLESILDNTGIDIYVNDFNTHEILYVNKSMAAPYGGQRKFDGRKCWQVLYPGQTGPCDFCPQENLVDENGEPTKVYTWDYQRPFDGSWFRVFSAAFRWIDGRLAHVVSSADITDNKQKEALIEYMANYDPLTKLPNRRMLVNECESRIRNATEKEQGYLLFFDIDGFKKINDNFGHDAGDEFLVRLGEFFTGIPLLKDAIYRNGGDEFVAIIGGETVTKEDIQLLASFILSRFQRPWVLKNGDVSCNTSIGVACYPEDGRTPEELLRIADMAMYQVKKSGGGGMCFGYQLNAT